MEKLSDNFVIEIDSKKIIEWMQERKKVQKDWATTYKAVQLQLEDVVQNGIPIQYEEIKQFLQENQKDFNYYHVDQMCEKLLKTDEAKQLTLLRQYSSKLLNQWLLLRELFRKNNLHIVNCSKILRQNLQFEIPGSKQNIQMMEKQIQQLRSKQNDNKNLIKQIQKDQDNTFEKIGIQGDNLQYQVSQLSSKLPKIFQEFVCKVKEQMMSDILQHYQAFSAYSNLKFDQQKTKQQMKVLQYLIEFDNDLIQLYNYKQENREISDSLRLLNEQKYQKYQKKEIVEIQEIDWNIQIESSEKTDIDWNNMITIEKSDPDDDWVKIEKIQTFETTDTILSNRNKRNEILTCLIELCYFIKQRILDASNSSSNSLLQAYDQNSSNEIFEVSVESLKKREIFIEQLTEILSCQQSRQLFTLNEEPKAQSRLIEYLRSFQNQIQKTQSQLQQNEKKEKEIQKSLEQENCKLQKLTEQSKQVFHLSQTLLSKLIGKEVKITGDILKLK